MVRTRLISGCAPVTLCPRTLCRGPVAVVGDAARQVNPLTAGGIMNALEAADLLVHCLGAPAIDIPMALRQYSERWRRRMRFEQKVFLLLQRVFLDSNDAELRRVLAQADTALGRLADRSRPFRWPVSALTRLCMLTAGKAIAHLPLLLR